MTDATIKAALSSLRVVALTLFGEARNEPVEGRIAVANVIRNRARSLSYQGDYREVCLRRKQFSCWMPEGGLRNYERLMSVAQAVIDGKPTPAVYAECEWIADGIMRGVVQDNVRGANHYFAPKGMPEGKEPIWARGKTPVCVIGGHQFYAL